MTLMDELRSLLKEDDRLVSEGKLLKNRVVELALKLDENLIKLLLKNEQIKQHFFKNIDNILIFDKEKFMKFIDNKEFLPDSYTAFKNKIGLITDKGEYISKSKEVVLSWPYKDCILEGGQEKPNEKRWEIFHNEVLAPDEIDRLLRPKVFTNFKRVNKDGEHDLDGFKRDSKINRKRNLPENTITDNLIITGNNLLVLHSLEKEFAGKIKLIYIDPPYNTKNDEFQYNDNFKESTWLTFMKNRLDVAKKLLRDDGVIFVQCDYHEEAYLKVLMDEIFGRENFINIVSVNSSTPSGVKTSHAKKKILKSQDFLLVYKKKEVTLNPQYKRKKKWDTHYRFFIEKEDNGNLKLIKLVDKLKELNLLDENGRIDDFDINNPEHKKFYLDYGDRIVRKSTHDNKKIKEICNTMYKNKIYTDENGNLYLNNDMLQPISKSFHKVLIGQKLEVDISNLVCDFWDDIDFQNTQNQGGVSFPAGKKPEQLVYRIIDMTTCSNDIVLDFFMGSGTTCAVAHKMGRQYIGVEQLDYGKNSAVVRLVNVINGDQSGMSKSLDWKGGGSFVYMELMKLNELYIDKIQNAKSTEELLDIWEDMKHNGFLSYRVDPILFDENINEFRALSFEEQKKLLVEMLDKNELYVNYSEIDDAIYDISAKDKRLNKDFYGEI
jgi:adenine-specific DNA-methyltransferase